MLCSSRRTELKMVLLKLNVWIVIFDCFFYDKAGKPDASTGKNWGDGCKPAEVIAKQLLIADAVVTLF